MRDAKYTKLLQQHLGAYRAETLRAHIGTWGKRGMPYKHVLRREDRHLNIVEPLRDRFWNLQASRQWKLHQLFHHLTSSQALAFNLFLPIYPELPTAFRYTRTVLGLIGDASASVDFEVELKSQDGRPIDGTNIDVLVTDTLQRRVVIEVKLTESAFGRATHDCRHLKKLRDIYTPLLDGRIGASLLEPHAFFRDYQLLRNLAQIRRESEDRVILLFPRAREQLWRFATSWCTRPELGEFASRISVVAIEDLVNAMLGDAVSTASDASAFVATADKYLASVSACVV